MFNLFDHAFCMAKLASKSYFDKNTITPSLDFITFQLLPLLSKVILVIVLFCSGYSIINFICIQVLMIMFILVSGYEFLFK